MATKKQKAAKRDKIDKETNDKAKKPVEEVKQPDNKMKADNKMKGQDKKGQDKKGKGK